MNNAAKVFVICKEEKTLISLQKRGIKNISTESPKHDENSPKYKKKLRWYYKLLLCLDDYISFPIKQYIVPKLNERFPTIQIFRIVGVLNSHELWPTMFSWNEHKRLLCNMDEERTTYMCFSLPRSTTPAYLPNKEVNASTHHVTLSIILNDKIT